MQINKFITLSRKVVQPTAPVWRYFEVANKTQSAGRPRLNRF